MFIPRHEEHTQLVQGTVRCFALLAILLGAHPASAVERPNVILVVTDDQGWGDLRFHGNGKIDTPTMDRLATAGARFDRFFVSPMCAPTRASLLTGRWNLR
jgi:arylsulfatase A-like enzyme